MRIVRSDTILNIAASLNLHKSVELILAAFIDNQTGNWVAGFKLNDLSSHHYRIGQFVGSY